MPTPTDGAPCPVLSGRTSCVECVCVRVSIGLCLYECREGGGGEEGGVSA